jgi:hypothetical protein
MEVRLPRRDRASVKASTVHLNHAGIGEKLEDVLRSERVRGVLEEPSP